VDNLLVKRSIHIKGINNPIITSKAGDEILTVMSDHVTITGLTLQGVTTSYLKERSAIRILNKKYFDIRDNEILGCFFGIYLEKASEGAISGNVLKSTPTSEAESGNGIHAWSSNRLTITDNYITGHRDGIYFEFVNESKIKNNHSEKNMRYGLHFMFSNDDEYAHNEFKNNGVGVAVMFSRRITMYNNEFSYNWGRSSYGLLLKEIYDAEIYNNTFEQNTVGIFVEGSNRIKYYNNMFERNGWGIKFSGGCEDNEITLNNFVNNSLDLVVNTKLATNRFHHNYWSYYSGYDLDRDGVGDVPHYPIKLFSYILDKVPEAIVLMRSFFVDIINFSERVSPVFTPKEVFDQYPSMTLIK
jgi:nitrous oxidase accessory protein